MGVKAVSLILCLQTVMVYATKPSCPDATFGREILVHTLETKTIVKALQQEIAGIRDGLYRRTALLNERMEIDDIKQNLTLLFARLERMEAKLDSFETTVAKDAFEKPAFSVVLAQTRLHQDNNNVIKFDGIISNIGGHYSELTGQFTVPMDGVYMFSASILADQNEEIWGYIKAGDKIVKINDRGTDNRHGQGSQTMVVALKTGDHVTVHGGPKIYGDSYTAFSGFLVQ